MSRWFRFHADALNNPKVQRLDGYTFKCWVNILCIACQSDGALPTSPDIAFSLRMSEEEVEKIIDRLVEARLLDESQETGLRPHGWDEHQYVSDASTGRVREFRMKRKRNVSETFHETRDETTPAVTVTAPEQNRTDTEQNRAEQSATFVTPPTPKVTTMTPRGPKASWESISETWKWYQAEYPTEVNSFVETQLFLSVVETPEDIADLRRNLPAYKLTQKWIDGFAPSSENFLSKRIFKVEPKARDSPGPRASVDPVVARAKADWEERRRDIGR